MELSFNELKKRDVINIADGRCLGRPTDVNFSFPSGTLAGITVPGRNQNFITAIFDRSKLYIDRKSIIKIGGDVILVNVNCGETCSESVTTGRAKIAPSEPPKKPCAPPCPPICPPPCPPTCNPNFSSCDGQGGIKIDLGDY